MLTGREETILKTIVGEHVKTGQPVGSARVARRSGIGVSPATIRHNMVHLEAEGYITHPHTSGGRIPLEKGYRYFVDSLMEEVEPSPSEQRIIRHQFSQIEGEVEEWSRLAAAILARMVRNASLATLPRSEETRLRHLELVYWQDLVALLILVLQGAKLRHQVLSLAQPATQDELTQVANRLNSKLAGRTIQEMRLEVEGLGSALEQEVAETAIKMLEAAEPSHRELRWEGMRHFLGQPEFSNSRQAQEVMEVLEEPAAWHGLISQILHAGGVHILIGPENSQEALRHCSVVLSRYGHPGGAMGVVGTLGPTRMPYGRAVGSVRYLASVMGNLVQELGI